MKNNHGKAKDSKKTIKKLLSYLFKNYKLMFLAVIILIVFGAFITTKEATFAGDVVGIIENMLSNGLSDFSPLYNLILTAAKVLLALSVQDFIYYPGRQ